MSKGSRREREAVDLYQRAGVLRELYEDQGKTIEAISDELGASSATIHYWMEKHDIDRDPSHADKPVYFGLVGDGYEAWQCNGAGERVSVYVHKLVAVAEHGYDAVSGADVHHVNGIKWDNRPSNLVPMDPSEHISQHVREQDRKSNGEFE